MRESSLVPTNLLDWPRCESLLPDQRLILLSLWSSPYLTCAGAGMYPIRPAASSLGLSPDALLGGIETLIDAGLVEMDTDTNEVFIIDWFRFHRFKTIPSQKILSSAIAKIISLSLRKLILEKSSSCFPTTTATSNSSSNMTTSPSVVECGGVFRNNLPTSFREAFKLATHDLTPELREDIADEFAGQLRNGKVRKPEALLRTLAAAARNGNLTLDAAREERQRREMQSRVEALRADAKKIEIDAEAAQAGIDLLTKIAPGLAARAGMQGSEA